MHLHPTIQETSLHAVLFDAASFPTELFHTEFFYAEILFVSYSLHNPFHIVSQNVLSHTHTEPLTNQLNGGNEFGSMV